MSVYNTLPQRISKDKANNKKETSLKRTPAETGTGQLTGILMNNISFSDDTEGGEKFTKTKLDADIEFFLSLKKSQ